MKIISYPDTFIVEILDEFKRILDSGQIAEGSYYTAASDYVIGKKSVPVTSCGAAIFSLLAYQKYVNGITHVVLQSNTMRGLYTSARLLDLDVIICNSSMDNGLLAMDAKRFQETILYLSQSKIIDKTTVVYSVIGGFLSDDYFEIENLCIEKGVPIIVDMAHGHYLEKIINTNYASLAFSFYATKILPVGEGGLISTNDAKIFSWIKKFLMYDRFDYSLETGLNLRANELNAKFIHMLMTNDEYRKYFRDYRIDVAEKYKMICNNNAIRYLDYSNAVDYNGYKFIVLDNYGDVERKNTELTINTPTSPVFCEHIVTKEPILYHWCPPTYPSLRG